MRKYERTHPWLKFQLNLEKEPAPLWLLLGEALSKCEHLKGAPLRPDLAQKVHTIYLAKGVLATTAIEGNTLSMEQVERRIEGKRELPPSKEYLGQEVDNIVEACNYLWNHVLNGQTAPVTPEVIKSFNRMVLKGLKLDDGVVAGEVRRHEVGVAKYKGAPSEDCEYLLDRMCSWLDDLTRQIEGHALAPAMPILRAILAHLYIAWIHPFGDGNGRTARLVEFTILVHAGVPTPAAHLLSNHYNETRTEYYRQLDHASRSGGDIAPFLVYAVQGFVDGLREQIAMVRDQQLDVTWRNYVYERFKGPQSKTGTRRRDLVLDLSHYGAPEGLPISRVREISVRIARAYEGMSSRTLLRDLQELIEMHLVIETPKGYAANKDVIKAFLPRAARPEATSRSVREAGGRERARPSTATV